MHTHSNRKEYTKLRGDASVLRRCRAYLVYTVKRHRALESEAVVRDNVLDWERCGSKEVIRAKTILIVHVHHNLGQPRRSDLEVRARAELRVQSLGTRPGPLCDRILPGLLLREQCDRTRARGRRRVSAEVISALFPELHTHTHTHTEERERQTESSAFFFSCVPSER